jgi:poly(hydroxyalkanoate) granule-associated protein
MATTSKSGPHGKGENQPAGSIMESAAQIWLAGLGAFAKTQEEGGKLFEALVKEGEKIEALSRKAADEMFEEVKSKVEEVRGKASEKLDKLEQAFQDRVARALNRLGVPTNDDIQEISKRLEALSDSIRKLSERR